MILVGDCRARLLELEPDTIDSIITDPPYHLTTAKKGGSGQASVNLDTPFGRARIGTGFMGMKWDGGDVAFQPELWAEALRVAKPGAYLAAFGGTRTFHRLACAIEVAGWELRDTLMWVYGSGFPKGTDKSKIPEGWQGFNTALKPAWEPIILARKPMRGTLAENLQRYGTGAMNIDACRVGARWPANLAHDGDPNVVGLFPAGAGASAQVRGTEPSAQTSNVYGNMRRGEGAFHDDAGSAARFFYCAKASQEDRDAGVEHAQRRALAYGNQAQAEVARGNLEHAGKSGMNTVKMRGNHHPTVKPTDLMRWLCRLLTPPGGMVLDPFCGSGSTGRGAIAEGMQFTGIELDPAYAAIAEARTRAQQPGFAFA